MYYKLSTVWHVWDIYILRFAIVYARNYKDRGAKGLKKGSVVLLAVLSILLCLPIFSSTAYGITGNFEAASTPYVGVIVLFSDTARQTPIGYCSGFLLSPTVMVTAGHSLVDAKAVSVCFDPGPISYKIEDGKIVYSGVSTIYHGTPMLYPGYVPSEHGNDMYSTSDIGLIILDNPVSGVTTFAKLPTEGLADTLPVGTDLRVVGYGVQYQTTPKNDGVIESWRGTLSRNVAQVTMSNTDFQGSDGYLKLSANAAQNKGGVAFGDSGGPVLYNDGDSQDIVLAVNAYVNSANCGGISYHTRLDVPEVIDWINEQLSK